MVEYNEYKKLQCIYNIFKNQNIYLEVLVVLNNNKKIHGFLLMVDHNKFSVLSKKTGRVMSISYRSIKRMDMININLIFLN